MRARLLALAVLVFVAAGCSWDGTSSNRPIPGTDGSHRVEQINSPGGG